MQYLSLQSYDGHGAKKSWAGKMRRHPIFIGFKWLQIRHESSRGSLKNGSANNSATIELVNILELNRSVSWWVYDRYVCVQVVGDIPHEAQEHETQEYTGCVLRQWNEAQFSGCSGEILISVISLVTTLVKILVASYNLNYLKLPLITTLVTTIITTQNFSYWLLNS